MDVLREALKRWIELEEEIQRCDQERRDLASGELSNAETNIKSLLTTSNYKRIAENLDRVKELESRAHDAWNEYLKLLKIEIAKGQSPPKS